MESEARSWMQEGELPVLLATGTPAAVFSYDQDEGERDAALFSEFGALVTSGVRTNPFAIKTSFPQVPGGSVFSGAAFAIKGFRKKQVDDQRVQQIQQLSCAIKQVFEDRGLTEHHSDAFRPCFVMRCGEVCEVLRVFDRIYFDPTTEKIFIAQDGVEVSGIPPLNAQGLRKMVEQTTTPLERACLAARVYFQIVNTP